MQAVMLSIRPKWCPLKENEPLVRCGECTKYQTTNCAAKHEQALMDFCSHGVRKPGGEQDGGEKIER